MKDHNIDRLVDALQRLTTEVQLFREAFVANNMSICESCSNNPCNKKVMLGDRRIFECTMYERKTENSSVLPNNCEGEPQTCEECEHWNDTEDGCADRHGCKTEPQTDYDKNLQLFADILFDKEKGEQFLKECKAMGIEPQTEECPFDDTIPCEWVNCPNSTDCPWK